MLNVFNSIFFNFFLSKDYLLKVNEIISQMIGPAWKWPRDSRSRVSLESGFPGKRNYRRVAECRVKDPF